MCYPGTPTVAPSNVEQARAWDGAEGTYWATHADRFDRLMAGYHRPLLDAAGIGEGARVLDIGCGTGQTTRDAARRAGSGHALGVDLSADMIDVARRRAAEQDLPHARFERADAQLCPFPTGGFDVAISRTGAMFFGDPYAAFGNIARALRPGARLALLTWQPAARNEWFRAAWSTLTGRTELPAPPPGAPGPFSLSKPGHVRALLTESGFRDVRLLARFEPVHFGGDVADAERFLVELLGWMLRDNSDPDRARTRLRGSLHAHRRPDGISYGSAAWLITAYR